MKICFIGHGRIEIPPKSSGAVESVITDYKFHCERLGHEVCIVNFGEPAELLKAVEAFAPDVIHLHDETRIGLLDSMKAQLKIVTCHDPLLSIKPAEHFRRFARGNFFIGCLADSQKELFKNRGVPDARLFPMINGARADLFQFSESAGNGKCVCLAALFPRKRQKFSAHIPCVVPVSDWTKADVHSRLTEFSASILISEYEAAPLAVVESLMAGLPVIVSEAAAVNLDRQNPFVLVVNENQIHNPHLLKVIVENFRRSAWQFRKMARAYAVAKFDWSKLVADYCDRLNSLLK